MKQDLLWARCSPVLHFAVYPLHSTLYPELTVLGNTCAVSRFHSELDNVQSCCGFTKRGCDALQP